MISLTAGPGRRSSRDWDVRTVTSTRVRPSGTKRRPRLISKRQGTENASEMSFLRMLKDGGGEGRQDAGPPRRSDPPGEEDELLEDLAGGGHTLPYGRAAVRSARLVAEWSYQALIREPAG